MFSQLCSSWARKVPRTYISSLRTYSNTSDLVLTESWTNDGAITKLTMNNASKRNCLSLKMMTALRDQIMIANQSDNIRVIVLGGNGPVFSAGHDLKELLAASENEDRETLEQIFATCTNLMLAVRESPIPIISMVHGWCSAAGLQLAAASDIIVSTQNCKFSTPGVNIGLFCSTPAVELSRCVGPKIAMEMLLTGKPIDASRAYDIGLVNHVTANEDMDALQQKTEEIALEIANKSKPVIAIGKKGFQKQIQMSLKEAHASAGCNMVDNLYIPDAKEGIRSFIEKRSPNWTHQSPK